MNKRKSLGRGLDALLSSARPVAPPPASAESPPPASPETGLREVPVDLLRRGKYQPRVDMREDSLAELAESIKAQGVVQPIVVRPLPNVTGGETEYEIVAGERRKGHNVIFGDGPFFRDHFLLDAEFFKVKAHGV